MRFVVLPNWRQIRKLAEMKDTLLECVRQAGALLLQHFGKNIGVTRRIERLIGVEAVRLPSDSVLDPQIAGALGAALFAHSLYRKENRDS